MEKGLPSQPRRCFHLVWTTRWTKEGRRTKQERQTSYRVSFPTLAARANSFDAGRHKQVLPGKFAGNIEAVCAKGREQWVTEDQPARVYDAHMFVPRARDRVLAALAVLSVAMQALPQNAPALSSEQ